MHKNVNYVVKQVSKCFQDASDRLWGGVGVESVAQGANVSEPEAFHGPVFPNPNKTREQKIAELEDHYSDILFGMDDEQLDQEYADRIG